MECQHSTAGVGAGDVCSGHTAAACLRPAFLLYKLASPPSLLPNPSPPTPQATSLAATQRKLETVDNV